jgi:hypothetical protein
VSDHDRIAYTRARPQLSLDLAWLDPETADFHLMIDAPEIVDLAVRPQPCAVPRAVNTRSRHAGKRIR